ncbi:hypothetical protein LAD67_05740 [Escherichia coli]|nr:hypothetical protein [Escherichia coli]
MSVIPYGEGISAKYARERTRENVSPGRAEQSSEQAENAKLRRGKLFRKTTINQLAFVAIGESEYLTAKSITECFISDSQNTLNYAEVKLITTEQKKKFAV